MEWNVERRNRKSSNSEFIKIVHTKCAFVSLPCFYSLIYNEFVAKNFALLFNLPFNLMLHSVIHFDRSVCSTNIKMHDAIGMVKDIMNNLYMRCFCNRFSYNNNTLNGIHVVNLPISSTVVSMILVPVQYLMQWSPSTFLNVCVLNKC